MKYLLVVAHPDDEVLGAGASMWKWSHDGDEVEVCIMCTRENARTKNHQPSHFNVVSFFHLHKT